MANYAGISQFLESMGLGGGRNGQAAPDDRQSYANVVPYLLDSIHEGYLRTQEVVRGICGPDTKIDEMAIMLGTTSDAMTVITEMVKYDGITLFNSACDEVNTEPIRGRYRVHYWFLSTDYDYRIEVMVLEDGYSPLHTMMHQALQGSAALSVATHASFKCADEETYARANVALRNSGRELMQRCTSDYGRFGYYGLPGEETDGSWMIKPRLNERDDTPHEQEPRRGTWSNIDEDGVATGTTGEITLRPNEPLPKAGELNLRQKDQLESLWNLPLNEVDQLQPDYYDERILGWPKMGLELEYSRRFPTEDKMPGTTEELLRSLRKTGPKKSWLSGGEFPSVGGFPPVRSDHGSGFAADFNAPEPGSEDDRS